MQVFHGPCPPQAQGVDAGPAPAHHRGVVGHCAHRFRRPPDLPGVARLVGHGVDTAAKADGVDHLGALELPGVAEIQPVLGLLLLPAIDDGLAEQAVFVADAVAVAGDAQGRHAFHEARRQAPQATVAQGRIGLQQADALQVHPQVGEGLAGHLQQPEVAQAVKQQAADKELQGQVVHPLLALAVDLPRVIHPVVDHVVPRGQGNGFEPVVVEGVIRVFAYRVGEFGQDGFAKSGHLSVANKGFLSHRYDL